MIKRAINSILEHRINLITKKKLKKIYTNIHKTIRFDKNVEREFSKLWFAFDHKPDVKYLYICSAINGIKSFQYVPENIYYNKIEPTLNNKAYALAYADKNFYERYLIEFKEHFPKSLIRGLNGILTDESYSPINLNLEKIKELIDSNSEYILKPSVETSGGENVRLFTNFEFKDDPRKFYGLILTAINSYKGNFVLQDKISPHKWFNRFNETSLNTVRLFTYRSVLDNQVIPVSAVLRFGRKGSIVDNQAAGGLTCGICREGKLSSFAIDKMGNKIFNIEALKENKNNEVPFFNEMIQLVSRVASKYPYQRLLGFDISIDSKDNIKLLEINCKNIEINFLQMNNGPLFGDYTDEIINFCKLNKKSIVLDFYA